MAFAHNVFYGNPLRFGFIGWKAWKYPERTSTIEKWRRWLHKHKCIESSTGIITHKSPVKNPSAHDFRLIKHSPAIDRGIKYFVPWGLYAVVGEWHFIPHPADISLIIGENINMNEEYFHRSMFQYIPRNHLHARNITENSFIHGTLENWTRGALSFDGEKQYCVLPHSELIKNYSWGPVGGHGYTGSFDGKKRKTVNMGKNNFLIEIVFRTTSAPGTLVCKMSEDASVGYMLKLNKTGKIAMCVAGGKNYKLIAVSKLCVNDGRWHHVIAEVNRKKGLVNIYIDGKLSPTEIFGNLPSALSIGNTGDFLVGKGVKGSFFAGAVDFLRISRGTLKDAETDIKELYQWEFNGPFLKDFLGRCPVGTCRDAGALEYYSKL